jgi:5'-deoxynucleotidase YfbR-like HD superfamily hydrolase
MKHLTSLLPSAGDKSSFETGMLQSLFNEYEDGITNEAILVKDIDKYELLVQALEYERDAVERGEELTGLKDLTTFYGVRKFIKTDLVKGWGDEVMKQRELLWTKTSGHTSNGTNGMAA